MRIARYIALAVNLMAVAICYAGSVVAASRGDWAWTFINYALSLIHAALAACHAGWMAKHGWHL